MKATKLLTLICLFLIISCSNNDDSKLFSNNEGQFIRFFLLVDSNNEVLEFPEISGGLVAVSAYDKHDVKTLKIPVAITSASLDGNTTATFETSLIGDIDLDISPLETLSFTPEKLIDTISVKINSRWDFSQIQQLKLKLISVSDPNIAIGIQNDLDSNDELLIDFLEPSLQYTFETNRIEITGEQGEEIEFKVNFPLGFFPEEINDDAIFEFLNGFDYTLTRNDLDSDENSINYKITLDEDIQNDDVLYQTIISLLDTDAYTATGNTILQLVKPINTIRELATNTAFNFHDLSDQFHRTYGEHWSDFNNDGICTWQAYFAFTYPVVVSADDENAILYDDMGTSDPLDDIYHHAFKIGFNAFTNPTATTNSFDLKRYFSNESGSSVNSPGFNIPSAIEFFPENGNSTTNGIAVIIPQFLTIASSNGNSYNIAISGEGTYLEISAGLFEISIALELTNDALFGGTVTSEYKIYSNNSYTEPEPLTTNTCITEIEL
ncbi:MAG: hypothetical protein V7719_14910 [Psychroserpens sp.]|uniref:hypothetical protein n=1 Tax=Psychroserpens sp. TaxID=2020870 RepID=UPI00300286AE